ncbi:MAG TPA: response regulator [Candidatus Bathyarchaeia archaeon]|nr:response regulator [Candidatus Bathyarchaeia archaeon]
MGTSSIRVLVAEDYEPFRRFLLSTLQNGWEVADIRVVSDGLEAVQEAQRLQPDLILLDIGLPTLDGFEAARQIRALSPASKIIFVTQESSADMVQEALNIGASGYVVKADVGRELIAAVRTVLGGEQFVGSRFAGQDFSGTSNLRTTDPFSPKEYPTSAPIPIRRVEIAPRHEAHFYSNDDFLLDGFTQCIVSALNGGSAVIVFASESHRNSLISRLQAHGIDTTAATDQRRYVPLDSVDILSKFMVDDLPDPIRLFKVLNDLIASVSSGTGGAPTRVVACGGLAPVLLSQGKPESAIRLEQLWDQVVKRYGLDTLCTYSRSSFESEQGKDVFQRICALHSAVHSQ